MRSLSFVLLIHILGAICRNSISMEQDEKLKYCMHWHTRVIYQVINFVVITFCWCSPHSRLTKKYVCVCLGSECVCVLFFLHPFLQCAVLKIHLVPGANLALVVRTTSVVGMASVR